MTGTALLGCVRADQRPHRMRVSGLEPVWIRRLVAGVAGGREPGCRVIRVSSVVVVVQVAVHAVGRKSCIHPARVTRRTVDGRVDANELIWVNEASTRIVVPRGRLVALLAIGWETSTAMVGIISGLIVIKVASNAIRGSPRVHTVPMAGRTIQRRVHAIQGERMIEICILPRAVASTVAEITGCWKARSAVIRIGRSLVIGQVAADTGSGCPRVDSVTVASRALYSCVLATQFVVVIENRLIPGDIVGTVAYVALCWEARGHVVRFPSTFVIFAVARIAIRGDRPVEPSIRVAANAVDGLMLPTNRKSSVRLVTPLGRDPSNRLVAILALYSEVGAIRVVLPANPVAVIAVRGRTLCLPVPMARCAGNVEVPTFERK